MGRVSMYDEKANGERIYWIRAISIMFAVVSVVYIAVMNFWERSITATVTNKEMTSNHSYIYITTEDGTETVLDNSDSLFRLKFNHTEIHGDLEVGKTYEFTVIGINYHSLGLYENIIDYRLVEDDNGEIMSDTASDNVDLVADLNKKKEQGFAIVMSMNGGIVDAEEDFLFTEEILAEYSIMVDYENKTIILNGK